ncbi:MAG: TonB family protein [Terriglobales bacterium]
MSEKRILILILGLAVVLCRPVPAQQNPVQAVINYKDVEVVDYEEMKYPTLAQYAPYQSEGVVVVQVTLDDEGRIAEAKAISGNFLLVPEVLANIKKWHFRSTGGKTAIIVYNFRKVAGECHSSSSVFTFQRPNFVTVLGCLPTSEGWVKIEPVPMGEVVSDSDMQVLNFDEDFKYPPLANQARIGGVVVLEVNLGKDGKVKEVVPLSGRPMLLTACVLSAQKWRFRPNAQKKAVIVYDFRLDGEGPGQTILEAPNFVTITNTPVLVETQSVSN